MGGLKRKLDEPASDGPCAGFAGTHIPARRLVYKENSWFRGRELYRCVFECLSNESQPLRNPQPAPVPVGGMDIDSY